MVERSPFLVAIMVLVASALVLSAMALGWTLNGPQRETCMGGGMGGMHGPCPGPTPDDSGPGDVEIGGFAFTPAALRISPGSTVTWVNRDRVVHTVSPINAVGPPSPSGNIAPGGEYSFTFLYPGVYEYFCEPHPYMGGTIVVDQAP
jgi:plastocyanin